MFELATSSVRDQYVTTQPTTERILEFVRLPGIVEFPYIRGKLHWIPHFTHPMTLANRIDRTIALIGLALVSFFVQSENH